MTTRPTTAVSWQRFTEEAPELAAAVRARLGSAKHHVLATLRRDGSPRVSGTEVQFHEADLVAGMMHGSVKALDLQRDGRFAIHANPGDGSMTGGDAKISGTATEVTDPDELATYAEAFGPPPPFHLFRLRLDQAVLTTVEGDRLVVQSWRPGRPVERAERF